MHHSKNFSKYSTQKKISLITLLIGKFVIFGAVFAGLIFVLKDYTSPTVLLVLTHVILLAGAIAVFFIHKHKSRQEEDCNCEVK
jgi:hypothetical protein